MGHERFCFRFERRFVPALALLGVRPHNSDVLVGDRHVLVRFGLWRIRTTIDNIQGLEISRDYQWFRVIGPHLSLADRGVTFGTNAKTGVCLRFHQPVEALFGRRILHPGATVTVDDPEGLVIALRRRMEPHVTE